MEALMTFIKDRVIERKLQQRDFAKQCGITESSMSRYLLGQRQPRIETYEKMLDVLGYEIHINPKDLKITDLF